jgi:hypothetical protein
LWKADFAPAGTPQVALSLEEPQRDESPDTTRVERDDIVIEGEATRAQGIRNDASDL